LVVISKTLLRVNTVLASLAKQSRGLGIGEELIAKRNKKAHKKAQW
jgi:hypothetical protein